MSKVVISTFFRFSIFLFLSSWLIACSSNVRTTITTFKNESTPFAVGTIRIAPIADLPKMKELEYGFYKAKLEEKLKSIGYTPVNDTSANYTAYLHFDVMRREKESADNDVRFVSTFGYGRGSRFGNFIIREPVAREFEFVRRIQIAVEDSITHTQLIEVDAFSLGRCEHLTTVADAMFTAIFKNFQRSSGSVERVIVPAEGACK